MSRLHLTLDDYLVEEITSDFDLRAPNKEALIELIKTLNGGYNSDDMQVLNLATGVGKTYLTAAFIEYLRKQGIGNVLIVTPGKTVQAKTVQNFSMGSPRYIVGSPVPVDVVTPQDYSKWVERQNRNVQRLPIGSTGELATLAFVFNIQQLIAPKETEGATKGSTQDSIRRKPRRFDENAGVLFDYLKGLDDLVVIADESHLYSSSAKAFSAALRELHPAATIGLTASPLKADNVIYRYPLYRAIQDGYVKKPVLAFRKDGYGADRSSEEQQLRDALSLRIIKQDYYTEYAKINSFKPLNAVLFVVCSDVEHANQVTRLLASPEYLGSAESVLQIDSKHEDEVTQKRLEELDSPHSKVLAVVSVNKLKEGWDVKNIAVVVTLRAMASEVLTQQTMGRGLRLPFGKVTGIDHIDQLDIIAHQSFKEILRAENVLEQFGLEAAVGDATTEEIRQAVSQFCGAPEYIQYEQYGQDSDGYMRLSENQTSSVDGGAAEIGALKLVPIDLLGHDGMRNKYRTKDEKPEDHSSASLSSISEIDHVVGFWRVQRNSRLADVSYNFPRTVVEAEQPPILLEEIDKNEVKEAARRVTSNGDILHRKEIIATLSKLKAVDIDSATIESMPVDEESVNKSLLYTIMSMQSLPEYPGMKPYAENYLIPQFVSYVSIEKWTKKSLVSAAAEMKDLLKNFINNNIQKTREVPKIVPLKLPHEGRILKPNEKVYPQGSVEKSKDYVNRRYYNGWRKSLFEEVSFDAYNTEFRLARILDTSSQILWWHRLGSADNAYVSYTPKNKYNPDFVVFDENNTYWIIETKNNQGKDDELVQEKRKAAEVVVKRLVSNEDYFGQRWGYLIAYQSDIDRIESWDELKFRVNPITNFIS